MLVIERETQSSASIYNPVTTVHDRQQSTVYWTSLHNIYISELVFSSTYTHPPVSQEVPTTNLRFLSKSKA